MNIPPYTHDEVIGKLRGRLQQARDELKAQLPTERTDPADAALVANVAELLDRVDKSLRDGKAQHIEVALKVLRELHEVHGVVASK